MSGKFADEIIDHCALKGPMQSPDWFLTDIGLGMMLIDVDNTNTLLPSHYSAHNGDGSVC